MLGELQELGVEQIDLTGTSLNDVGYGQEVRLVIKGKVNLPGISFQGFNMPLLTKRKTDIHIAKVSIAKN